MEECKGLGNRMGIAGAGFNGAFLLLLRQSCEEAIALPSPASSPAFPHEPRHDRRQATEQHQKAHRLHPHHTHIDFAQADQQRKRHDGSGAALGLAQFGRTQEQIVLGEAIAQGRCRLPDFLGMQNNMAQVAAVGLQVSGDRFLQRMVVLFPRVFQRDLAVGIYGNNVLHGEFGDRRFNRPIIAPRQIGHFVGIQRWYGKIPRADPTTQIAGRVGTAKAEAQKHQVKAQKFRPPKIQRIEGRLGHGSFSAQGPNQQRAG